jgi:hypothetical protein
VSSQSCDAAASFPSMNPPSTPDGHTRYSVLALMRYILEHPLRPTAKQVGLTLATHLNSGGSGWCSVVQLCREVGSEEEPASNSTISRALRELCQGTPTVSACLKQARRGPGRPATYRIRSSVLAWWDQRAVRKAARQPRRAMTKRASPAAVVAAALPAGLQQFLAAYPPHRRDKFKPAHLQLAWLERGAPEGVELEVLVRDLERWKASNRWRSHGGRWVPSPSRFLRHPRYREAPPPSAVRAQLPDPRPSYAEKPPARPPEQAPSEVDKERIRALVGGLCAQLGPNAPQAKVRL